MFLKESGLKGKVNYEVRLLLKALSAIFMHILATHEILYTTYLPS
jgi:hypothetical protein